MSNRLGYASNTFPLLAPVDSVTTAYDSIFVDLKNAVHATFFLYLGVITGAATTSHPTITMEAATAAASATAPTAIPFTYRLSAATGTNTWGAATTVANTGVALDVVASDGKMLMIDINPAALEALVGTARFVRMHVGLVGGGSVCLNAIWAEIEPSYAGATMLSAAS
jgi:hypothetical protein